MEADALARLRAVQPTGPGRLRWELIARAAAGEALPTGEAREALRALSARQARGRLGGRTLPTGLRRIVDVPEALWRPGWALSDRAVRQLARGPAVWSAEPEALDYLGGGPHRILFLWTAPAPSDVYADGATLGPWLEAKAPRLGAALAALGGGRPLGLSAGEYLADPWRRRRLKRRGCPPAGEGRWLEVEL